MAQVQNINQTVEYQEGSVVSKEIINKPAVTVTIFAFARGQGLSEHTAPYDALVMITDGHAQIFVSHIQHDVKAGQMLLIPAYAPHALKAVKPFKMLLTMVKSS